MVDKYGVYMQHIENVIADMSKKTDKHTLEGKRRKLQNAKVILMSSLFIDILEPARELR